MHKRLALLASASRVRSPVGEKDSGEWWPLLLNGWRGSNCIYYTASGHDHDMYERKGQASTFECDVACPKHHGRLEHRTKVIEALLIERDGPHGHPIRARTKKRLETVGEP
jgi:hypothetical protein